MQAAQRKTDYNIAPLKAKKRVVKMRGNVAYINNDFLNEAKPRTKTQAKPRTKTQARPASKTQARPTNKAQARPTNKTQARPAQKRPRAQTKAKPRINAKTEQKTAVGRSIAATLFVVFMAFCALALLVSRHAAITSIGVQNNVLQKDITAIEAQIDELALDIELRSTVQSVQNAARELGMTYHVNNQKIYIDINS